MKEMLLEQNWKTVGRIAHKMIPAFRHFMISNLVNDLKMIEEKTLVQKKFNNVESIVLHLEKESLKIINEMKKELNQLIPHL